MTIRINRNRSTALERSVINYWFYARATPALGSAVIHGHTVLFSWRETFMLPKFY